MRAWKRPAEHVLYAPLICGLRRQCKEQPAPAAPKRRENKGFVPSLTPPGSENPLIRGVFSAGQALKRQFQPQNPAGIGIRGLRTPHRVPPTSSEPASPRRRDDSPRGLQAATAIVRSVSLDCSRAAVGQSPMHEQVPPARTSIPSAPTSLRATAESLQPGCGRYARKQTKAAEPPVFDHREPRRPAVWSWVRIREQRPNAGEPSGGDGLKR